MTICPRCRTVLWRCDFCHALRCWCAPGSQYHAVARQRQHYTDEGKPYQQSHVKEPRQLTLGRTG